ncbi:endoplasmic reticulum metallopeptidase 1 [Olea europaea var. sylvestris]|uniref:endoplasmic reticulum metallopeptidase 1 n=1 Tax=Olea europaea var. sylvestris TaxID=158386 RepID=UPI000C1D0A46|nr:endoplasmic reticulum metallopeptidase 1 [Olea europaea var. sylvestris]
MAFFKLTSGDITGFKVLFALAIMYGLISYIVHSAIYMEFIKPLGIDAPLDRFSEARAIEHVRVLSEDIGGRQEGSPGLRKAAEYIKAQLDVTKERAGSNLRIEIEETTVTGSFNMIFLGHSISLAYRNHTNILMRISSVDSQDADASVLLNGHFDTPPGSPGAGDCGSCVASLLELARLTVDSDWVPPKPVIFLFNGAEELFLLGSHGFMTTHKWRDTVGAFVDIEASGTGGFDLVCQSGPGSWPSSVYAQSAMYPMANSAAQDFFGAIPGDTDYRMFSKDYGDIPGLDIIFLLGGYFYHTSFDTVERLLPGSMQARGDNLFSLMKAFTNSSKLLNAQERAIFRASANESDNQQAIFFDYYSRFLVFYSRKQAILFHSIPVAIFLLMPLLLRLPSCGLICLFNTYCDFLKGMLYHASGIILAVVFPVTFAILRLLFCGHSMHWFANPCLAFMMFVPCSLIGLIFPRICWRCFPLSQDVSALASSKEELVDEARFWGAFGFYSLFTLAYLVAGLGGGFATFLILVFIFPAWMIFRLSVKSFGHQSLRSTTCYVVPLIPCIMYSVYFGGFLAVFLIEKMGMTGSHPPPYGYFVPDVIVAAIIGVVTGWCVGPLLPVIGKWLATPSIVQFLVHGSVLALALSSQFFPYSTDAPKRVILQHTIETADVDQILDASYDFSVVDSNSLLFVFKHAPEVAKELYINSELKFDTVNQSQHERWMGIFPISSLFSRSLKFPAKTEDILEQYQNFPLLSTYQPQIISTGGSRRVYLEFSLGSLKEVWVAVLNITGPLSNWSFANNMLPAPEKVGNGPPSYICRLSGAHHENWTFWLEAGSSEALRIDVSVMDLYLTESTKRLKGLFPNWMDITTFTSFISTYTF